MPNRIIKESINESKSLSELRPFSQDMYKRLITYSDDYGRFNSDTQIMRARLYTREMDSVMEQDIVEALIELAGSGKIRFYTNTVRDNEVFGYMPKWDSHQRVRNTRAKCPDPESEEVNDWALKRFIPIALKIRIAERDGFTCKECQRDFTMEGFTTKQNLRLLDGALHFDHIVPVIMGGRCTEENLRLLCASCNLSRPKKPSHDELLQFAATCGKERPVDTGCGLNPIHTNPNPESNPESNTNPTRMERREFSSLYFSTFGKQMSGMLNHDQEKICATYSPDKIRDAFKIAAENNAETIKYVEKVLQGDGRFKPRHKNEEDSAFDRLQEGLRGWK